MAKMLEALQRAERERQQQAGAPGPAAEATARIAATPGLPPPGAADQERAGTGATDAELVSDLIIGAYDNFSPIAEQVRQVRTNLEAVLPQNVANPIVVTSPVPGDGKTLVTGNLAWVLADNHERKVLLIDADMRKPCQTKLYRVHRTPGLAECLSGQASLAQGIRPIPCAGRNLFIMPAGRPPQNPTTLLTGQRLAEVTEELKQEYDWIVFDTPPLLPVTDAAIITRHCVGLLLVIRMGQTHRRLIERAQELLAEMRLPVLGCVLNEFAPKATSDSYYHQYYAKAYGSDERKR